MLKRPRQVKIYEFTRTNGITYGEVGKDRYKVENGVRTPISEKEYDDNLWEHIAND